MFQLGESKHLESASGALKSSNDHKDNQIFEINKNDHKLKANNDVISTTRSILESNSKLIQSRRSFMCIITASLSYPKAGMATEMKQKKAKGAAEYDMEFYIRDIIKGNNTPGGNLPPSIPPPKKLPRTLTAPLQSILMDDFACVPDDNTIADVCRFNSIPAQLLIQIIDESSSSRSNSIESSILLSAQVNKYRSASLRGFASKAQWLKNDVTDQYYFDVTAYALYRAAGNIISNYVIRNQFVKQLGKKIYQLGKTQGFFASTDATTIQSQLKSSNAKTNTNNEFFSGSLTQTIPALYEVLNTFNDTQFCSSYRLGQSNDDSNDKIGGYIFDSLDDEDIATNGYSIDCLISIYEPATLGASLQITAEGSRFSPDFIGPTLVAMWEDYGIKATYETYFVDPEYRPNPKDFFPNEQLYQFSLSMMKK